MLLWVSCFPLSLGPYIQLCTLKLCFVLPGVDLNGAIYFKFRSFFPPRAQDLSFSTSVLINHWNKPSKQPSQENLHPPIKIGLKGCKSSSVKLAWKFRTSLTWTLKKLLLGPRASLGWRSFSELIMELSLKWLIICW